MESNRTAHTAREYQSSGNNQMVGDCTFLDVIAYPSMDEGDGSDKFISNGEIQGYDKNSRQDRERMKNHEFLKLHKGEVPNIRSLPVLLSHSFGHYVGEVVDYHVDEQNRLRAVLKITDKLARERLANGDYKHVSIRYKKNVDGRTGRKTGLEVEEISLVKSPLHRECEIQMMAGETITDEQNGIDQWHETMEGQQQQQQQDLGQMNQGNASAAQSMDFGADSTSQIQGQTGSLAQQQQPQGNQFGQQNHVDEQMEDPSNPQQKLQQIQAMQQQHQKQQMMQQTQAQQQRNVASQYDNLTREQLIFRQKQLEEELENRNKLDMIEYSSKSKALWKELEDVAAEMPGKRKIQEQGVESLYRNGAGRILMEAFQTKIFGQKQENERLKAELESLKRSSEGMEPNAKRQRTTPPQQSNVSTPVGQRQNVMQQPIQGQQQQQQQQQMNRAQQGYPSNATTVAQQQQRGAQNGAVALDAMRTRFTGFGGPQQNTRNGVVNGAHPAGAGQTQQQMQQQQQQMPNKSMNMQQQQQQLPFAGNSRAQQIPQINSHLASSLNRNIAALPGHKYPIMHHGEQPEDIAAITGPGAMGQKYHSYSSNSNRIYDPYSSEIQAVCGDYLSSTYGEDGFVPNAFDQILNGGNFSSGQMENLDNDGMYDVGSVLNGITYN